MPFLELQGCHGADDSDFFAATWQSDRVNAVVAIQVRTKSSSHPAALFTQQCSRARTVRRPTRYAVVEDA
jgi:hypothetical protein